MVPEPFKLSCKVEVDDAFENRKEDFYWKTCTWTRLGQADDGSDDATCRIEAVNDNNYKQDICDSSIGRHTIGAEDDRLECTITLFESKEIDHGAWRCTLQKCKDSQFGGCGSDRSDCSSSIVVNATVIYFQKQRFQIEGKLNQGRNSYLLRNFF